MKVLLTLTATALSFPFGSAEAQDLPSYRLICQNFGPAIGEPLGDRPGHAVTVSSYTCKVDGGPMNGSVSTGSNISETSGESVKGLVGSMVTRKPGSMVVTVNDQSKTTLIMADGKVIGSTGAGHGRYAVATGDASSLAGHSYKFSTKGAGPGQFIVEVTPE